jgi:hypothetical protein
MNQARADQATKDAQQASCCLMAMAWLMTLMTELKAC